MRRRGQVAVAVAIPLAMALAAGPAWAAPLQEGATDGFGSNENGAPEVDVGVNEDCNGYTCEITYGDNGEEGGSGTESPPSETPSKSEKPASSSGAGKSPYSACWTFTVQAGGSVTEAAFASTSLPTGGGIYFSGPVTVEETTDYSVCHRRSDDALVLMGPVSEEEGGVDPQVIIDSLIEQAFRSLELPYPTPSSAPVGSDDEPMITQLPTWLWLDESVSSPITVTAGPVAGFTVTVTAIPGDVSFAGGGNTVSCGPGTWSVYDYGLPESAQSTECSITYQHSSSVEAATLTASVDWSGEWVCEPNCGSGTLPTLTMTETVDVRVAELQALLIDP
jgi:hypothetical protein